MMGLSGFDKNKILKIRGLSGNKIMKWDNWIKNIFLAMLISMLTVSIAVASNLSKPKADGLIGEQANGYIGLVRQDVAADIKKLVKEVNAKRKAGYQKIATKQGTSLSEVEKVGGNTAYQKTLKGNYIRDVNGVWQKK
jgi:uncharacterized protein YdbL (DUF1318 family)